MLFSLFLVTAGLAILFLGGESLVRGSVSIAGHLRLPKLVIGLLIVGFGTSMPELLVSIQASFSGSPEIALGNVVGSNIANVLLIIGAAAVMMPLKGWNIHSIRGAVVALLAAVLLYAFSFSDVLGFHHGLILICMLVGYLTASYFILSRNPDDADYSTEGLDPVDAILHRYPGLAAAATVAGILLLMLGADLLITGAVTIARQFGISDAIIGLSLVAFGTSLPELVAAIVSAIKREAEVVIGSIIGSNIFNILAILGITLMLSPIPVAERINSFDTPLVLATSLAMLVMLKLVQQMGRMTGVVMLGLYTAYIAALIGQSGL